MGSFGDDKCPLGFFSTNNNNICSHDIIIFSRLSPYFYANIVINYQLSKFISDFLLIFLKTLFLLTNFLSLKHIITLYETKNRYYPQGEGDADG